MFAHPELRALRRDDTPQCDAQGALLQAVADWRARPDIAAIHAELEEFAAGVPIAGCPAVAALFAPGNAAARRLAADFSAMTCAALAVWPLGHVPLRHYTDGTTSTILIARAVNVTLSLVGINGEGLGLRPESASASFGPTQTWEHILAGTAAVEQVECQPTGPREARLRRSAQEIGPGSVMYRDGMHDARLLRRIDGALVSLRLQRRCENSGETREYDLATGALLHQAASNPRDSRIELMLATLGRMGRTDAAPLMAEMARGNGSTALRWQALRECLALDTRSGFAALTDLAARPEDALCGPASALRAQLLESYPQLQGAELCPA